MVTSQWDDTRRGAHWATIYGKCVCGHCMAIVFAYRTSASNRCVCVHSLTYIEAIQYERKKMHGISTRISRKAPSTAAMGIHF